MNKLWYVASFALMLEIFDILIRFDTAWFILGPAIVILGALLGHWRHKHVEEYERQRRCDEDFSTR